MAAGRIDLSNYAGDEQLMLRFDFSTAGLMNDPTLGYVEDWNEDGVVSRFEGFGEFFSSRANYDPVRGLNNDNEGFYVDDIVIGFAERGEMATSAPADQQGYSDLELDARTRTTNDISHLQEQWSGYYQMEIRRSEDYAVLDGTGIVIAPYSPLDVMGLIDTNERVARATPSSPRPATASWTAPRSPSLAAIPRCSNSTATESSRQAVSQFCSRLECPTTRSPPTSAMRSTAWPTLASPPSWPTRTPTASIC